MAGRRDVEALLWQWFDAETEVRFISESDHLASWKAEDAKKAKEAASRALAAVLKALRVEPSTVTVVSATPQNSRDSDFP